MPDGQNPNPDPIKLEYATSSPGGARHVVAADAITGAFGLLLVGFFGVAATLLPIVGVYMMLEDSHLLIGTLLMLFGIASGTLACTMGIAVVRRLWRL